MLALAGSKEGLAPVLLKQGGMWGYVDRQFREAIPAPFREAGEFYEGLAAVKDSESGRSGCIERSGAWALPPRRCRAASGA